MFDSRMLQEIVQGQCRNDKVVLAGAWALGPNIFVTRVKALGSENWLFLFYYDAGYATFRDLATISNKTRELLVCLLNGTISSQCGFPVEMFHFARKGTANCPVGEELADAFEIAKTVLIGTSNEEINWFSDPKEVPLVFL